jgi:hypothetical protein
MHGSCHVALRVAQKLEAPEKPMITSYMNLLRSGPLDTSSWKLHNRTCTSFRQIARFMGNASMKLAWIRRSDAAHRLCVPKTQIRT